MTKGNVFRSGLVLTLFLLLVSGAALAANNQTSNQTPAAVVNGQKISKSALNQRVSQRVQQDIMQIVQIAIRYKPQFAQFLYTNKTVRKEYNSFLRSKVLETMIEEVLKKQTAREKGITVTDQELDQAVDQQIQTIIDQNKQFSSPADIDKYLNNNRNSSLKEYKQQLRKNQRETLLIEKLKSNVLGSKKKPTEKEIKSYYNNNKKQFTDKNGNVKPLPEVRSQIVSQLNKQQEQQRQKAWQDWLKEAKKKADIKRYI